LTLRHVVMWKLASTDEAERADQAARIKAGLEALPAVIPEILRFEVGVNSLPANEFDVVLVSDFAALRRAPRAREGGVVHPLGRLGPRSGRRRGLNASVPGA